MCAPKIKKQNGWRAKKRANFESGSFRRAKRERSKKNNNNADLVFLFCKRQETISKKNAPKGGVCFSQKRRSAARAVGGQSNETWLLRAAAAVAIVHFHLITIFAVIFTIISALKSHQNSAKNSRKCCAHTHTHARARARACCCVFRSFRHFATSSRHSRSLVAPRARAVYDAVQGARTRARARARARPRRRSLVRCMQLHRGALG